MNKPLVFFLLMLLPSLALAQSLGSRDREIGRLKMEQDSTRIVIERIKRNEWSVLEAMKVITANVERNQKALAKIKLDLAKTERAIERGRRSLLHLQAAIKRDSKRLDEEIQGLYRVQKLREATLLPGLKSFEHYGRNQRLLQMNLTLDAETVDRLNQNLDLQREEQTEMESRLITLGNLQVAEENQKQALQFEERQQKLYLSHLQKDKKLKLKYLQEIQIELERLNSVIHNLQQQKALPQPKDFTGFRNLEASLPAPVPGKLVLGFGQASEDRDLLYKKGLLIQTQPQAVVTAVLTGKVAFSGPFRGYDNLVILDHGKGSFSVYGHLKELLAQPGQVLSQGQELGTVELNPSHNLPLLYFETRYRNRAVDPSKWLKQPAWLEELPQLALDLEDSSGDTPAPLLPSPDASSDQAEQIDPEPKAPAQP